MKSMSLFLLVFSFSNLVSAAPVSELFEELKESGANYDIIGMVCEKVAVIELEKIYPAKDYDIVNGIVYGDSSRTIGELDVVIFDKRSQDAVLVGEVKCWKSFSGARAKAHDQRQRFQKNLGRKISMQDGDNHQYDTRQFRNVQRYVAIAQKGAKANGFDIELENTLGELMDLRGLLMKCQSQGRCPRH
ncbi:MAG: hypothetical protein ACK5P7_06180 [Bdellovibrio sp.]|jgi:hypothetical protein